MPTRTSSSKFTAEPRRGSQKRRSRLVALLFFLPAIAVNLLVIGGPAVAGIVYSFTDWNGISPPQFLGLENWQRMLTDETFWAVMRNNAVYLFVLLTIPIGLGLVCAFLLTRIRRGSALFRVLFFIPYLLISVVAAQIWKNLLNPDTGIASVLNSIGIKWLNDVYFLGSKEYAFPTVMGVHVWTFIGFTTIFFYAAMKTVDPALIEAARLDGVSAWGEFWHIVIPGIRPMLIFALSFAVIGGLLVYDMPQILTGGGPAGSSEVAALLINRTAITGREAGYGSTLALTLTLISGVVIGIVTYLRRKEEN
ncbi:sugar ABC transporter permease [Clavibacter michiganensis subsp. phaseoli]|uniref:Sugar ABC transporter permease n=1 Tax=Clavibacter phaseoli TaxID=1734031 RepID=A0A8I0SDM5_9MICO|nr:sugar ABC transporter permease [Clavibacter phaseoli]MBF4632720.1 sugar ABC transporter permease [Clavibacter phaseoli]